MQKILAIDDKKDNLITLSAVLANLMPDCLVSTALSGKEGIDKAGTGQPDVILLDVKMPDMDGFETCRRLKTDPCTSAIPIIIITAIKTDHQSRIKGLDLGADAFLAKPIDEVELVAQVKVALRIKKAEDALRRERDSLEHMVAERTRELTQTATLLAQTESISHTGSWRHEVATDKVTWSKEMYNIFGLDPAAFKHDVNEVVALAVHPEDRPKLYEINAAVRRDGIPRPLEYRIVHPVKGVRWVYGAGEQEMDASGRVIALVGFLQDITERKRMEVERQTLITAIEQTPVAIALTDPQGSFQYVNPAFAMITGYSGAEVKGQNPRILKSGKHNQAFYADLWKTISDGRIWKGRMTNKRKDGSLYVEDAIISPVVDPCDRVINFVSIRRDITAEMDMEKKLRQAQKMEAIGTLAGGIAHDFNNILGAIIGYAEMIRDDALAVSASVQDINQVLKAGNRAKELVKQILAFGRQGETEFIAVQPAAIIKEAIKLLRASIPTTIAIQMDIDPEAGTILADPTQIHQILMNLCTNAFHAMETHGGTLTVGLHKKSHTGEDLGASPHLPPGNYLHLSIEDSGEGIAPEILDKIFDPFFTTKEVGKGTGMGLSMVHGIVHSIGGTITCSSRPGEGTVFHIILPTVEQHTVQESESSQPSPFGTEHILLVDDEEILLQMGQMMLERLGYRVTTRMSSLEALTTFQNEPKKFDMVLCDQTMPGMTGEDLSRRLLQIRPDIPILLCTGYSSLISETKAKALGIKGFAMKPLTKKDIAVLIRQVLGKV